MYSQPRTSQERILGAAKQVFAAHGYRGGSLIDAAMLAGYTRAGLLHHYASKQAVLLALLDLRDGAAPQGGLCSRRRVDLHDD